MIKKGSNQKEGTLARGRQRAEGRGQKGRSLEV